LYPTLPIIAAVHDEHLLAMQAMKLSATGFVMDVRCHRIASPRLEQGATAP
jgi:hypothetical protein